MLGIQCSSLKSGRDPGVSWADYESSFVVIRLFVNLQTFDAYLVGPPGAPGVVVIQEWWGVDFEIKNHASTLAAKGYRCLIPE